MYYVKNALYTVQVIVDLVEHAMDLTEMTTSKDAESDQQPHTQVLEDVCMIRCK